jgi:hypothetical protein
MGKTFKKYRGFTIQITTNEMLKSTVFRITQDKTQRVCLERTKPEAVNPKEFRKELTLLIDEELDKKDPFGLAKNSPSIVKKLEKAKVERVVVKPTIIEKKDESEKKSDTVPKVKSRGKTQKRDGGKRKSRAKSSQSVKDA